jgi:hypothetical protein
MISMFAWSVRDHEFEHKSGQNKDYNIGIRCFPAKHAALRLVGLKLGSYVDCCFSELALQKSN